MFREGLQRLFQIEQRVDSCSANTCAQSKFYGQSLNEIVEGATHREIFLLRSLWIWLGRIVIGLTLLIDWSKRLVT